jgi:hypothetical protein
VRKKADAAANDTRGCLLELLVKYSDSRVGFSNEFSIIALISTSEVNLLQFATFLAKRRFTLASKINTR